MSTIAPTPLLPTGPTEGSNYLLLLKRLASYAPATHPVVWCITNSVCAFASALALADLLIATDDFLERPFATALYLIWNFATTGVWLVEIGLTVVWHIWTALNEDGNRTMASDAGFWSLVTRIPWIPRIELLLAVYFLLDSMRLLWKWQLQGQDVEAELVEVVINFLAYLYMCWETYSRAASSSSPRVTELGMDDEPMSNPVAAAEDDTGLIMT